MKNPIRNTLCLGLLVAPAFSQDSQPTSPEFEKARIVEELEHDLRGAAQLYEELLTAAETSYELKGRTLLRLGLVYRELGEEAKAQEALGKAAQGTGESAMRARESLARAPRDTQGQLELRQQAEAALERVQLGFAGMPRRQYIEEFGVSLGNWSAAAEDLVWLGSAAVPVLRRELESWFDAEDGEVLATAEGKGMAGRSNRQLESPQLQAGFALNYQSHLTSILWENGTPEARDYLRELAMGGDPRRTWSLALGLLECGELNPRMLSLLTEFLSDTNTTIGAFRLANAAITRVNPRRKRSIIGQLSPAQFLGMARTVSAAAAVDLWRKLDELHYGIAGLDTEGLGLADTIRDLLTTSHPGLNQIGFKVLGEYGLRNPALRRLTLEYIGQLPVGFRLRVTSAVPTVAGYSSDSRLTLSMEPGEIDGLLEAIRLAGPLSDDYDQRSVAARTVETMGPLYVRGGGPEVLPVIAPLFDANYIDSSDAELWIGHNGTPEFIPEIFRAMETAACFDRCFPGLSKQTLNQECLPGLMAALDRLHRELGLEAELGVKQEPYKQTARSVWQLALDCLTRIDSPKSVEYLLDLAKNGEYGDAAVALVQISERGTLGDLRDELRGLLATPSGPNPPTWNPWGRSQVLARLVALGDEPVFLEPNDWARLEFNNGGTGVFGSEINHELVKSPLIWLAGKRSSKGGSKQTPLHRYTANQLAQIWTYHLTHPKVFPNTNPYEFLGLALEGRTPLVRPLEESQLILEGIVWPASEAWVARIRTGDYPKTALEREGLYILQNYLNIYVWDQREGAGLVSEAPLTLDLIGDSLRCDDAHVAIGAMRALEYDYDAIWGPDVRRWILDPEVGPLALGTLANLGLPLSGEDFNGVATSPYEPVRQRLVENLGRLATHLPVERMFPLLSDEESWIRMTACQYLAQRLDDTAVPALLNLLGDSEVNVRTAAKEALEQIRFYHDEKARWERFFQGQEVSTVGAAQRLLQQAAPDQPLAQRLLAIRSLGSLGAPEVLPFLIEWVGQGPSEVRMAGEKAIEQILGTPAEARIKAQDSK